MKSLIPFCCLNTEWIFLVYLELDTALTASLLLRQTNKIHLSLGWTELVL